MPTPDGPVLCTIIAKNYLAGARVLCESFLRLHPAAACYALVIDDFAGYFDPAREPFRVVTLAELNIPDLRGFTFQYNVLELATAAKPYLLEYLLDREPARRVFYLDPDILVTNPLGALYSLLDDADVLLTPHVEEDYPEDGARPTAQNILLTGVFNLGFVGVRDSANARAFLRWWQRKLYRGCLLDPAAGYFVDQRYVDLAPVLFDGVRVVRDAGYNAAWWNLHCRAIKRGARGWECNGGPLYFYHFSNYDPRHPEEICRRQNRFHLTELPDLTRLFAEYRTRLLAAGHENSRRWPYGFGYFANGERIGEEIRRHYREHPERWREYGDPFKSKSLMNLPYRSRGFLSAYLRLIRSRLRLRTRVRRLVARGVAREGAGRARSGPHEPLVPGASARR